MASGLLNQIPINYFKVFSCNVINCETFKWSKTFSLLLRAERAAQYFIEDNEMCPTAWDRSKGQSQEAACVRTAACSVSWASFVPAAHGNTMF